VRQGLLAVTPGLGEVAGQTGLATPFQLVIQKQGKELDRGEVGVAPFWWTVKDLHDSASISMGHLVSERRCIAEG
jgi:hypothetical protein